MYMRMTVGQNGLGIETGFAVAKNIPVYVLFQKGRVLSPTIQGVCKKCFEYETDVLCNHKIHNYVFL